MSPGRSVSDTWTRCQRSRACTRRRSQSDTAKSIGPLARCAIACTTGTDKASESRRASGPSTCTNGVRTPAASHTVRSSVLILFLLAGARLPPDRARPLPSDRQARRSRLRERELVGEDGARRQRARQADDAWRPVPACHLPYGRAAQLPRAALPVAVANLEGGAHLHRHTAWL